MMKKTYLKHCFLCLVVVARHKALEGGEGVAERVLPAHDPHRGCLCPFFLVGYENPYDENPDFNAPLLTGVLITFVLLLLLMAVAVTLFAVYRTLRRMRGHTGVVNGVPALRIALGVGLGTFCIMILSFALASTDAMSVNGVQYADGLWLRVAEMFVDTSLLLLVAAVVAVAYGYVRRVRNRRKEAQNAH